MDELLKAVKTPVSYTNFLISSASLSIVKSTPGFLHAVINGMVSNPTLTLYDNASGASGTILLNLDSGAPSGIYLIDLPVLSGVSAWVTATGKIPTFNISSR